MWGYLLVRQLLAKGEISGRVSRVRARLWVGGGRKERESLIGRRRRSQRVVRSFGRSESPHFRYVFDDTCSRSFDSQHRIVSNSTFDSDVKVPAALNLPFGQLFFGFKVAPYTPAETSTSPSSPGIPTQVTQFLILLISRITYPWTSPSRNLLHLSAQGIPSVAVPLPRQSTTQPHHLSRAKRKRRKRPQPKTPIRHPRGAVQARRSGVLSRGRPGLSGQVVPASHSPRNGTTPLEPGRNRNRSRSRRRGVRRRIGAWMMMMLL